MSNRSSRLIMWSLLGVFFTVDVAVAKEITGVSGLVIGMSESEFLEMEDFRGKRMQRIDNQSEVDEYKKIYAPNLVKYKLEVQTGIPNFRDIDSYPTTLDFFNDKLIYISIDVGGSSKKFETVLNEKYGKPIFKDSMVYEVCQNGYGAKSQHLTGSMYWDWNKNSQIKARLSTVSRNCGKFTYSIYSIYDDKKTSEALKLENTLREKAKKENDASKALNSKL